MSVQAMRRAASRAGQRGRSLVELMVALAIGVAVTLGVVAMHAASTRATSAAMGLSGAEYSGNALLLMMSRSLEQAGFGEILGGDATVRAGQTLFDGAAVIGCQGGRFADVAAGDFSCVPGTGDAVAVRLQADSIVQPSTGVLRDCTGEIAPNAIYNDAGLLNGTTRPVVTNAWWLDSANGNIMCRGGTAADAGVVIGQVEDFRVYYGVDEAALTAAPGTVNATPTATSFRGANWVRAQATPNAWGAVVSVYVCARIRTPEASRVQGGSVPERVCPATEAGVGQPLPTQNFSDGVARRTFVGLFTVRNQATANPLVGVQP